MTGPDDTECSTPEYEAAALLTWLQENHAICRIDSDGFLKVDLNPIVIIADLETADNIARAVMRLRAELKAILRSQAAVH